MFPSNKQSEFTVRLDHPIRIDVESWEVALVEIATPSSKHNRRKQLFLFDCPGLNPVYAELEIKT